MDLIYREETEQLIKGFFAVQNEVGLGRHEEAYHQAYNIWVAEQSMPVSSKPPLPLLVAGREAIVLYPDFVAWDQIILEMKAVPRPIEPSEERQLFDYLRARGGRLGLLVNMGLDRVHDGAQATVGSCRKFRSHGAADQCSPASRQLVLLLSSVPRLCHPCY